MTSTEPRNIRHLEHESDLAPPFDLLVEAAKSVIESGVLWPELGNFIDVISQIELYRIRAVELGHSLLTARACLNLHASNERRIRDALDNKWHSELRSQYLSMMMLIRRAITVRRLRRKEVEEAEISYAKYWPRDISLWQCDPTPFTLAIISMSPKERSELAAEAASVRQSLDDIRSWCVRHPSFTPEAFDVQFPELVDKKWVGIAIRWINDVRNVVKKISDCLQ